MFAWRSTLLTCGLLAAAAVPARGQGTSPYDNVLNRPAVSPYLNLLRGDATGINNIPNYQTFVRPVLDQRNINQQQALAVRNLQRQLQQVAAQPRSRVAAPSPSGIQRQTGHQSRFLISPYYNNLSHYYGQSLVGP